MPVSLERVQELTGKSVTFLEADLRCCCILMMIVLVGGIVLMMNIRPLNGTTACELSVFISAIKIRKKEDLRNVFLKAEAENFKIGNIAK